MDRAYKPEDIPKLFAKSWNNRDAQVLASLFTKDADFVNVVGLWWDNRDDIERAHHYGLTKIFNMSELSARKVKVRKVGEDVAIIHVRWRLTGQTSIDEKALDERFTIMVFVAKLEKDKWIVLAAQNTDIIPGKETLAVKDGQVDAVDYRT